MTLDNEQIVRKAYQIAEDKDLKGWADAFTADGTFTDNSIGVVYRGPDGPDGLPVQVENYARAFPDMRWTCLSGRCGRPASGWTHRAVTSSNWSTARSSASTATPKARSSSPSSA